MERERDTEREECVLFKCVTIEVGFAKALFLLTNANN